MFESYVCGVASPHCAARADWTVLMRIAGDEYAMHQLVP